MAISVTPHDMGMSITVDVMLMSNKATDTESLIACPFIQNMVMHMT